MFNSFRFCSTSLFVQVFVQQHFVCPCVFVQQKPEQDKFLFNKMSLFNNILLFGTFHGYAGQDFVQQNWFCSTKNDFCSTKYSFVQQYFVLFRFLFNKVRFCSTNPSLFNKLAFCSTSCSTIFCSESVFVQQIRVCSTNSFLFNKLFNNILFGVCFCSTNPSLFNKVFVFCSTKHKLLFNKYGCCSTKMWFVQQYFVVSSNNTNSCSTRFFVQQYFV